ENKQRGNKRREATDKSRKRTREKWRYLSFGSILLIIVLFTSVSVNAQVNRRAHIHYGVTANFHQTRINDFHLHSKGRMGADFGFFVQIPIQMQGGMYSYSEPLFFVVPQLEFSMMGENSKHGSEATRKYHYDFVNIPIYAKYYLNGLKPYGDDRFFIMAGPMVGFALNEQVDMTNDNEQQIAQEIFQSFNFAVSVKAGYSPFRGFEAFIRLDRGINKVYSAYDSNNYHGKLGVGISWIFR